VLGRVCISAILVCVFKFNDDAALRRSRWRMTCFELGRRGGGVRDVGQSWLYQLDADRHHPPFLPLPSRATSTCLLSTRRMCGYLVADFMNGIELSL